MKKYTLTQELLDLLKERGVPAEAAEAYLDDHYYEQDQVDWGLIDELCDNYRGRYGSKRDFADGLAEEVYNVDDVGGYFDYESYCRDIFMCDYEFIDGYVFSSF